MAFVHDVPAPSLNFNVPIDGTFPIDLTATAPPAGYLAIPSLLPCFICSAYILGPKTLTAKKKKM